MRRNKQSLIIATVIIAIVGLSIGFAAFSSTLIIKSGADVNPNASDFRLVFANNTNVNDLDYGAVTPLNDNTLGSNGTIDNTSNPKISGLRASFTTTGQSVSYKVYVVNTGKYDAYLTNLDFQAPAGSNYKVCTPATGTTASLVNAACEGIYVTVQIGNDTFSSNGNLVNEISNHKIGPNENEAVTITLTYSENATLPDGDFQVTFGDIMLQYRTVDAPSEIVTPGESESQEQTIGPSERSIFGVKVETDGQGNEYGVLTDYDKKYATTVLSDSTRVTIPSTWYETEEIIGEFDDEACANSAYSGRCDDIKTGVESKDSNYIMIAKNFGFVEVYYLTTNKEVTIKEIGYIAFVAKQIEYVDIPDSITSIGESAFEDNNLSSINLPNGLITIGTNAFQDNSLTSLTIPNTVTTIGERAFNLNQISSLTLSTNLATIEESAFEYNKLTSVDIPDSVTTIGRSAFNYNNLNSVKIGSGIISIGDTSFANLSRVSNTNGITYGPNTLSSVIIDSNQTKVSVGTGSFEGFTGTICWLKDDPTCGE